MGASNSSVVVDKAIEKLGTRATAVQQRFKEISASNAGALTVGVFGQECLPGLPSVMVRGIFDEVRRMAAPQPTNINTVLVEGPMNAHDFIVYCASALAGSCGEKARILCAALGRTPNESALRELIQVAVAAASPSEGVGDSRQGNPETLVTFLTGKALAKLGKAGLLGEMETEINEDRFSRFLQQWPIAEAVFDCLLGHFCMSSPMEGNAVMKPIESVCASRLLDYYTTVVLNQSLPPRIRGQWQMLFSSKRDGKSFATFRQKLVSAGSTVLIVKDKDGHLFGGFANENWVACPDFYGSEACFLFSVKPRLNVFKPSGHNRNFMYFNSAMAALPNGVGMGGQQRYFGLFVDSTLEHGQSRAQPLSTTFNSQMLSKEPEFDVAEVELWRVGPAPEGATQSEKSILEGNAEDKAILELAGKEMKSEGLIEPFEDDVVIDQKTGKPKRQVF